MAKQFLHFQSIVQYRVPIGSDGEAGEPEVLKRYTTPMKGTNRTIKSTKKKPKTLSSKQEGAVEL